MMPLLYEAIIFDCDGTLVDSEPLINAVLVEYATEFGLTLTLDEALARFKGHSMAHCVSHLESLRGCALPPAFVPEFRKRTTQALATQLRGIDGAIELVRSLKVPFCVASSGPREKIEMSLSVTGLLPYFKNRIFSSYEVGSWKPDPGLFLHAAQALGVSPVRCAVVEDSMPGVRAGIAAGMTVFALANAAMRLQLPEGVVAIDRLHDLAELIV